MTELSSPEDPGRAGLVRTVLRARHRLTRRGRSGHRRYRVTVSLTSRGLPSAMTNELLQFADGTQGIASTSTSTTSASSSWVTSPIEGARRSGAPARSSRAGGRRLPRPGHRPTGQPDRRSPGEVGRGRRRALELRPHRRPAPLGHEPLQTGLKAVDAMTPVGRGQRQLIIGDRQTGKTTVAVDTIINQKANWDSGDPVKQVRCIYVAIGQKGSTIAAVRGTLEEAGALALRPSSPPRLRRGRLQVPSRHTPARPSASTGCMPASTSSSSSTTCPNRPRPTARCPCCCVAPGPRGPTQVTSSTCTAGSSSAFRAKLSDDMGAGSMTGLPIIETKAGDVSAYIPTRTSSRSRTGRSTSSPTCSSSNVRPPSTWVSRSPAGGSAESRRWDVAGRLKEIDLAPFRAMEAFAMFASDLDLASRAAGRAPGSSSCSSETVQPRTRSRTRWSRSGRARPTSSTISGQRHPAVRASSSTCFGAATPGPREHPRTRTSSDDDPRLADQARSPSSRATSPRWCGRRCGWHRGVRGDRRGAHRPGQDRQADR